MPLTPEEDQELRRITFLAQFGELPDLMVRRQAELRARDRRTDIREPTLDVQWLPHQTERENAAEETEQPAALAES